MAKKYTIKRGTEGEVEMRCRECGEKYYLSGPPETNADLLCDECLYK